MKKIILVTFLLLSNSVFAESVFKCQTPDGRVVYQTEECVEQAQMQEIEIHTIDPAIAEQAQKELDLIQDDEEKQAAEPQAKGEPKSSQKAEPDNTEDRPAPEYIDDYYLGSPDRPNPEHKPVGS